MPLSTSVPETSSRSRWTPTPSGRARPSSLMDLMSCEPESQDARTPLDEVRSRLGQLERPSFRISCREADWLGANDLQSLAAIYPDSPTTVLRLDPLSDEEIAAFLSTRLSSNNPQEFLDEARQQGLGALLNNPQTVILLVDAVAHKRHLA